MNARRALRALPFALGAVVLAFVGRAQRLHAFRVATSAVQFDDVFHYPPPAWLSVLSLGYRSALADLFWCRSLVYFGEGLAHRVAVRHVFDYADAIIALDPDFLDAYRWVSTATLFRPEAVDLDDAERAAQYLERAVERWPEDGALRWDLASLLRFDIAPLVKDPQRKRALLERAAPHLAEAARRGAGPPWLALNSASLLESVGQTQQALKHLVEMLPFVSDDATRAEVRARIAQLETKLGIRPALP